jgi:hypothetical protein
MEPLSDSHQVGRITITYDIDADGHMSSTYDSSEELPLVTQLGLLRMAEDTAIRVAMDGDDDDT